MNSFDLDQLLARCRELDPTFEVTFIVHDEIRFECQDGNRDAILKLFVDHKLGELEGVDRR